MRISHFLLALTTSGTLCAQNFGGFPGFPGFGEGGFPGFGEGGFPGFSGGFSFGEDGFGGFNGGFGFEMPDGPTGNVDFESSSLPLIQIDTDSLRITQQGKIMARMTITDNGAGKRNKPEDKPNDYSGHIGIKIRGNSSAAFTQKRFTIETREADGRNRKASLLGLPADKDWVLLGPYNDRSMMRDVLAFDLWNRMGHWAPHTRYAELLLNGEYRGVYVLCEKISRGKERINIKRIKPTDTEGTALTGGYIVRVDAVDADKATFPSVIDGVGSAGGFGGMMGGFGGGFLDFGGGEGGNGGGFGGGGFGGGFGGGGFLDFGGNGNNASNANNTQQRLSHPVTWSVYFPKKENLQPEQLAYIQQYVADAERAIQSGKDYERYIDVPSFVDYFIHTEVSLNADGFKRSAYFYKDRQTEDGKGGLLHAGTVWDYNLAYGNCNFCSANDIYAWVYNGCETNPTPAMWKTLAADKNFMEQVKKRYTELRKTTLSNEALYAFIDSNARLLAEAQERQYQKYPDLLEQPKDNQSDNQPAQSADANNPFGGGDANPFGSFGGGDANPFGGFGFGGGMMGGMGGTSWFDAYTVASYDEEIAVLKKWLTDRLAFLDSQWLK